MGVASLSAKYVLAVLGAIGVRCPELGGVRSRRFKRTVSIGKSIGGMSSVRCIEFVCFSEGPLLEVLLYCS